MTNFSNIKSILITGASSGLGKELSIQFAKKGIILFLTGREKNRLLETANICEKKGAKVFFKSLDIRNRKDVKKWILECDKIANIDLIIANAGISAGTSDGVETEEQIYNIFDTNIYGVLNTIEPIIPKMIKRKKGQIAIISSMSAFIGMASCPAYSASKACVMNYGQALRGYLKQYNIKVSVVCPSFIRTPLTDKNKFKMPLIMTTEKASKKIIKGLSRNEGLITFPIIIYIVLKLIRILPFSWINFIFSRLPKK
ncbi:MAG TPA: SDR family NAD(P)-dependent oxidoreductase [Rickettsiales bacterium]|nr:SDR family NAD(P)-dependent oxidoreductase [Rickettsiales bacterium]